MGAGDNSSRQVRGCKLATSRTGVCVYLRVGGSLATPCVLTSLLSADFRQKSRAPTWITVCTVRMSHGSCRNRPDPPPTETSPVE